MFRRLIIIGSILSIVGLGITNAHAQHSTSTTTPTPIMLDEDCLGKDAAFAPYTDVLTYCDDAYIYIEANSLADHDMMIGITAWNQQVPLPQPFYEDNAWQIPLYPIMAEQVTAVPGQGAVAVAINGVMIFNPTKQDGIYAEDHDPYLIGELDTCGGHAGRADDYHYHIAPNCILEELGAIDNYTDPIAYALDGYPIYGYFNSDGTLPSNLDECGGEYDETGNYHYHASPDYPYINGCFSGVYDMSLQPATHPIRPAGEPIHVLITDYYEDADGWFHLEYDYSGTQHSINYREIADDCYEFQFVEDVSVDDDLDVETYCSGFDYNSNRPPPNGDDSDRPPPPRDD